MSFIGRDPERTLGFISLIHLDADAGDGGPRDRNHSVRRNVRRWRDASPAMKLDHFPRIDTPFYVEPNIQITREKLHTGTANLKFPVFFADC